MKINKKIKVAFSLLMGIALFAWIDTVILGEQEVSDTPVRYTADRATEEVKSNRNIAALKMGVSSKSKDGYFHVGSEAEVACDLENNGGEKMGPFHSLIRTPIGEITAASVKTLSPGEKKSLQGTLKLSQQGMLIIACRADSNEQVAESDESDNREVAVIYVLP